MNLVWEEPPSRPKAEPTLSELLRERPGSWAKVVTGDKVQVSRQGGDLHREGLEIRMTDVADADGAYSLFARWNPDGPGTSVVRPGDAEGPSLEAQLTTALTDVLARFWAAAEERRERNPEVAPDLTEVSAAARDAIHRLFAGVNASAVQRYLRDVG